ncbi:MAG: dockerin type I domain-containing protein [Halanaerobiaceae bacterium]
MKRWPVYVLAVVLILTFATGISLAATLGDVNEDGTIDSMDCTALIMSVLGTEDVSKDVADVNGDGALDSSDVSLIVEYILGGIDEFPSEEEEEPDPPSEALEISIDGDNTYQEIEGFGGSVAYYGNWLTDHPNNDEIYDVIYEDLGIDILRLNNWSHDSRYGYQVDQWTEEEEWDDEFDPVAEELVAEGKERTDDELKVMMTAWTPHPDLKSNDSPVGGTLKEENGGYVYDEYADYWLESLDKYEEIGVELDYLSIQNEPDFETSYESCLLDPVEGENASYIEAHEAVYDTLNNNLDEDEMPKMIGPDVTGIGYDRVQEYVDELDQDKLDGISFHLYHGGDNDEDPHPPSFSDNLNALVDQYPDQKKYQTEFYRGDAFNTAWTMHTNLTEGNVSAYLYWDLIWESDGLITLDDPSIEEDQRESQWDYEDGYHRTDSYYSFKHFAAYIEPGSQRVEAEAEGSDIEASAYISPDEEKMTVVLLNTGQYDEVIYLNPDSFNITGSEVYRTDWENEKAEDVGNLGDGYSVEIPSESLVTIVVE